jgi:transcriptional regulator with XRE-family HTH domain
MAPVEHDRDSAIAKRLRLLRKAQGDDSASGWARRMDMSPQQYSNYESGYPLPRDAAITLATRVPGLTTDWLFMGREEGLSVELGRRLRQAALADPDNV